MPQLLAIVHQPDAGPGEFADVISEAGIELAFWYPHETGPPADLGGYGAAISFGGDAHPDEDSDRPWLASERAVLRELRTLGTPLLGICLGAELLAQAAGARVERAGRPEIGFHHVRLTGAGIRDQLLGGMPAEFEALSWHSYQCGLPVTAASLARSDAGIQAFRVGPRAWGIQFHPEVTATDFNAWLDDYESDPDAVEYGENPEVLRTDVAGKIEAWNELGRGLCRRFLAAAGLI